MEASEEPPLDDKNLRPLFSAATSVGGNRHGKQAGAASVLIHVSAIALLFSLAGTGPTAVRESQQRRQWHVTRLILPALLRPSDPDRGGGSGGGAMLRASFGEAAPVANQQFVPPIPAATRTSFTLLVEPTIVGPADIRFPDVGAPDWGDPSAAPGPPSPGTGCCDGNGDGHGTSVGPGQGPGWGPQGPGGYGPVFTAFRDGVSAPIPIYKVEPDYSEEARKAKFQGTVVLEIVIDERGYPTNFKIPNPLGLGLDEKAVEAVRKWRFRPGMRNGKPVAVFAKVEVTFRLL